MSESRDDDKTVSTCPKYNARLPSLPHRRLLKVPDTAVSTLVGYARKTLNRIERKTGATVSVGAPPLVKGKKSRGRKSGPRRTVLVAGTTEVSVGHAEMLVWKATARHYDNSAQVCVSEKNAKRLSKGSPSLLSVLGDNAGAVVQLQRSSLCCVEGKKKVTVIGRDVCVERALTTLRQRLGLWPGALECRGCEDVSCEDDDDDGISEGETVVRDREKE